jgi:hypothetical protein
MVEPPLNGAPEVRMAADYEQMLRDLLDFYDFRGKDLIAIGAGGGQLAGYGSQARRVFAVDQSADALKQLALALEKIGLSDRFALVQSDFYALQLQGDVLLFEFCLHELPDAAAALRKAGQLAADVVIFDHAPGSQWAYCVAEEEKVAHAWRVLRALPELQEQREYSTRQHFADYGELLAKVGSQGEVAIRRIEKWRHVKGIDIPMTYALARMYYPRGAKTENR